MENCTRLDMPPLSELGEEGVETYEQHVLIPVTCKHWLFNWTVAGGLLGITVLMGWMCIVGLLILKEQWQLVLMAWVIIYCIVHFTYWYCKRNSLYFFNRNIRIRIIAHLGETSLLGSILSEKEDSPPSYDDVIETEQPPPSYVTAVAQNQCVIESRGMSRVCIHQSKQDEANHSHQTPDTGPPEGSLPDEYATQ
ncbi:unnamed protein product [Meganyctiphanes norvegica]|uniref:Uncharacterized protein n=1 Tax=Meganyctiphanes norvegica TaxID=48144 RepID=A0AAV2RGL9_MEGNR